jgi:hypothetical protein
VKQYDCNNKHTHEYLYYKCSVYVMQCLHAYLDFSHVRQATYTKPIELTIQGTCYTLAYTSFACSSIAINNDR